MAQDVLQPDSPVKTNEEQAMPNIEIVPVTENDQPNNRQPKQTQADVHDSMSNTSLSLEEILALKIKKPTKALKRLQKIRKLSTRSRSSHSFDASLANNGNDSINFLIQELKANISKVDLLNAIEGDARLGDDIKSLLAELNKQQMYDALV